MDYLEIARARQSCRAYDATRPVEEEKLLTCLEAIAIFKATQPSLFFCMIHFLTHST